jgi:hypothetical protein
MDNSGEIINENRAKQLICFSGLRYNNITPTDIDGLIEYQNKYYIWLELKYSYAEIKYGQKLAFERICDDLEKSGKPTIFIIADHFVHNPEIQIDAASTIVREYRYKRRWYIPQLDNTLTKDLIQKFLEKQEKLNYLEG